MRNKELVLTANIVRIFMRIMVFAIDTRLDLTRLIGPRRDICLHQQNIIIQWNTINVNICKLQLNFVKKFFRNITFILQKTAMTHSSWLIDGHVVTRAKKMTCTWDPKGGQAPGLLLKGAWPTYHWPIIIFRHNSMQPQHKVAPSANLGFCVRFSNSAELSWSAERFRVQQTWRRLV